MKSQCRYEANTLERGMMKETEQEQEMQHNYEALQPPLGDSSPQEIIQEITSK